MLRAAIFDLDGLLIDSEPLWRRAEVELFATVGVRLTEAECEETTGLRIDEVVAYRHRQKPWAEPAVHDLASRIVDRMLVLVRSDAHPKEGGSEAIERCARR